jgi:hypothetical protein
MLESNDFREAANQVRDDGVRPGSARMLESADFADAAKKVRDDDD